MTMMEQVTRLRKDLKDASATLSTQEARYLVDAFYLFQDDRKRAHNQVRALDESKEPHSVITWLADNSAMLENEIKKVLDVYSSTKQVGRWMKSNHGIGPVITAGMMAHIDINKAPTVGHIWRFAGLDPTVRWEPKTKRPWNAQLKVLCWKLGQSFIKFSNAEDCFYGHVYRDRKHNYEAPRNERGENAERCKRILAEKNFDKSTEAYKHLTGGKLPPAQIDAMARRHAVKLFLSHLQLVWYWSEFGKLPPSPYAIAVLGHAHFVPPPNIEVADGLEAALRSRGA